MGISASILTGISMLPQLIKIIKEKKAEDVSLAMLLTLFFGLVLWTVYGIFKHDLIIICSNSFSLLINGIILFVVLKNNLIK